VPSRKKKVACSERDVIKFPRHAAGRAWRAGHAPRLINIASRPNKRMHATRDTTDVIISIGTGGRVMRSVRC
jgi:hypothetical protein